MSGIATAIAGTAVLGYAGSQKAGEAQATAAKDSAAISAQTAEKNIEFQKWLWGEQKELQQPWVDAGERALSQYMSAIGQPFTLDDLYKDPSYQWRFNEGQRAYETSGAARGMQLSGPQVKELTGYGQGMASTEYQNAFARRQTELDNLYRMVAGGQASAAGQAQQGSTMGSQVSSSYNMAGQGAMQAAQQIGMANAASAMAPYNIMSDLGNLGVQYYGYKQLGGG